MSNNSDLLFDLLGDSATRIKNSLPVFSQGEHNHVGNLLIHYLSLSSVTIQNVFKKLHGLII